MALKRHVSTSTTAPGAPVATVVRHSAHGRLPSLRGVHRRRLSTWATVADDVDVDGQQPKGLVEGSYLHQGERCPYWKIPGARPSSSPPVVLVHPVGVGLAKWFWIPLMIALQTKSFDSDVYAPDLLGTGGCSAYKAYQGSSSDLAGEWADQLRSFIANEVQEPAVVVTQGALGTVGIELAAGSNNTNLVKGLVMSTPPSWEAVSSEFNPLVRGAIWNLLTWPGGHSPFGKAFYQSSHYHHHIIIIINIIINIICHYPIIHLHYHHRRRCRRHRHHQVRFHREISPSIQLQKPVLIG